MSDDGLSRVPRGVLRRQLLAGLLASGPLLLTSIVLLNVVAGLLPAAAATLLQRAVDALVTGQPPLTWFVLSLAAGLGGTLVSPLDHYLRAVQGRRCQVWSLDSLYRGVGSLPTLRELEDPAFRDGLVVAQGAGAQAPTDLFGGAMDMVRGVLTASSFLLLILRSAPWAAPFVLLAMLPVALFSWQLARYRVALIRRTSRLERRAEVYAGMLTDLHAAKEIKLFGTAGYFRELMSQDVRAAVRDQNRFEGRWLLREGGVELAAAVVSGGVGVYLVVQGTHGTLTVGEVTMLLAALVTLQSTAAGLAQTVGHLRTSIGTFEDFARLVGLSASPAPRPGPARRGVPANGLFLDGVSFRYPQAEVDALHRVTLHLERGATTAVVGFNGSGKTTLVKLLCRFYEPTEGRIYLDGEDIAGMDLAVYRQRISAVFQDYMAYELTVRDNVTVGDHDKPVDDADVWRHLREVGLEERFAGRGEGLDTLLTRSFYYGEELPANALLSGGQWQRLAVARARYRGGREIQLYDEPTANLDPMAEWEISRLMDQRGPRTIAVCVSHRLATVRAAARIYVLRDGRVVEHGSDAELRATGGLYALMCERQEEGLLTAGDREPGGHDLWVSSQT